MDYIKRFDSVGQFLETATVLRRLLFQAATPAGAVTLLIRAGVDAVMLRRVRSAGPQAASYLERQCRDESMSSVIDFSRGRQKGDRRRRGVRGATRDKDCDSTRAVSEIGTRDLAWRR